MLTVAVGVNKNYLDYEEEKENAEEIDNKDDDEAYEERAEDSGIHDFSPLN